MKINKMMNIFTILIACFFLFNIENILSLEIYMYNSFAFFIVSFVSFVLMYGKTIYNAYKYEIFIKEKECIKLIFIFKVFSVVYYIIPFVLGFISIYRYSVYNVVGAEMVLSTVLNSVFVLKRVFKY